MRIITVSSLLGYKRKKKDLKNKMYPKYLAWFLAYGNTQYTLPITTLLYELFSAIQQSKLRSNTWYGLRH